MPFCGRWARIGIWFDEPAPLTPGWPRLGPGNRPLGAAGDRPDEDTSPG